MLVGRRLRLRAFLEGFEVPCISAVVQVGLNAPASCALQIVPTEESADLKPRTMVHVFVLKSSVNEDIDGEEDGDNWMQDYDLYFAGEVAGINYGKTPSSRQVVLQCLDFSSYWDTAYQFFISFGPNGNMLNAQTAVWGGGEAFNNITGGTMHVVNSYLQKSKPVTPGLENVKGLMGGIIALIEAMGGVRNRTKGVNDFFTVAELKNNLMQQIVAHQDDTTEKRLFSGKAFWDWLNKGMTGLGAVTTIRDILNLVFRHIYYDFVPNPSAMYVPGNARELGTVQRRILVGGWPSQAEKNQLLNLAKSASGLVQSYASASSMEEAQRYIPSIKVSASIRSMLSSGGSKIPPKAKRFLGVAAFYADRGESLANYASTTWGDAFQLTAINSWTKVVESLESALGIRKKSTAKKISKTVVKREAQIPRLNTMIFRPECFFAPPPRCNVVFPEQYMQYQFGRTFLREPTRMWMSTGAMFVGAQIGGYYHTVTHAPSMSDIKKNAAEQGNSGLRGLLPWEIYTGILPKFESISELAHVAASSERRLNVRAAGLKGPAASYSQRAANFHFLRHRLASRVSTLSGPYNRNMVCGFPALIIDRPFTFTAEKLKEVVAASIRNGDDDPINFNSPIASMRKIATELGAPMHTLGLVAGLTHSVGQDGGVTNITMSHVRGHQLTDDDYLIQESTERSKNLKYRTRGTTYDFTALEREEDVDGLIELYKATPQNMTLQDLVLAGPGVSTDTAINARPSPQAKITETAPAPANLPNTPLTKLFSSGQSNLTGKTVPATLHTGETIKVSAVSGDEATEIRVGKEGPRGGTIKQISIDDPRIIVSDAGDIKNAKLGEKVLYWAKITIYEEVEEASIIQEVPVEEAMRPPWLSPLYSNWLIGKRVYEPFFGVGSIVDQMAIQFAENETRVFGVTPEDERELGKQIDNADGDIDAIRDIIRSYVPANRKGKIKVRMPDVEGAVDTLAYIYGKVRQEGLDVHQFIEEYTGRPIASMEDILGSPGLSYEPIEGKEALRVTPDSGTPGFHSRALLPYGRLIGLLDNPDQDLPSRFKGKSGKISRNTDPRPGRRAAVKAYVNSLNAASSGLALGLEG